MSGPLELSFLLPALVLLAVRAWSRQTHALRSRRQILLLDLTSAAFLALFAMAVAIRFESLA